jgi:hypothetical protein
MTKRSSDDFDLDNTDDPYCSRPVGDAAGAIRSRARNTAEHTELFAAAAARRIGGQLAELRQRAEQIRRSKPRFAC